MNNLLKKINQKSKIKELGELLDSMTEIINDLVQDGLKLQEEKKKLDIRYQSLELTVREKNRELQQLKQALKEKEAKISELHKEVTEKKMIAAFYERLADKAIEEKSRLKMKYCQPVTEGPGGIKVTANDEKENPHTSGN